VKMIVSCLIWLVIAVLVLAVILALTSGVRR
jgi:hypothetical protein